MTLGQTSAIVFAQWRSLWNHQRRRGRNTFLLPLLFGTVWYGFWCVGAFGVAVIAADADSLPTLSQGLAVGLLAVFLYWQVVPILMVSTGVSLNLSRLLIYPIPHRNLFAIEVLLRITTSLEMLLVSAGLFIGLLLNPALPAWAPLGLLPFVATNLFLSAGLRDLLSRLFERKGLREILILGLVLITALPQVLILTGVPDRVRPLLEKGFGPYWPWSAAAEISVGHANIFLLFAAGAWTALAYLFGRQQFQRTLRFDAAEERADRSTQSKLALADRVARAVGALLPDPLSALVEKEIRTLSRSARFRLLFLMGFSFGLLIWLPLMRSTAESGFRSNYLTVVSAYALMLLGEVLFWNHLGMDRSAVQTYFVAPIRFSTVLVAKNIAAAVFVTLEMTVVAMICAGLGMPISAGKTVEAYAVTAVLTLFLVSMGNIMSTRYPRAVDPAKSWRTSSGGHVQLYLLLLYPIASAPILLAYGARFAFDTEWAFYAVLLVDVLLGAIVYSVALDSAVGTALRRKEDVLSSLSQVQGPLGT